MPQHARTKSRAVRCYARGLAARFFVVGLVASVASSACRPADTPTVAPASAAGDGESDAPSDAQPEPLEHEAHSEPPFENAFVITLASHCRHTWNGMLVPGEEHEGQARPNASGWEPGGFEVRQSSNRDLFMRRGDSLLLTNPSGGIMALRFDNLTAGYGALVEVTPECSGVNQKVVRTAAH